MPYDIIVNDHVIFQEGKVMELLCYEKEMKTDGIIIMLRNQKWWNYYTFRAALNKTKYLITLGDAPIKPSNIHLKEQKIINIYWTTIRLIDHFNSSNTNKSLLHVKFHVKTHDEKDMLIKRLQ